MINVALVGLGRIADVHYPGYIGNRDARILAVCDTNEDTALRRKAEWNIPKHYTSFEEVLADPEIDAVEILTPTMMHAEMTIKALEAGKHVAVQKPMANTLTEADAMIAAAKKAGKLLKVSDNYVFYPPTLLAKKLIEDGEIGTPHNIRIKLISGGSGGWEVPASAWAWRIKEGQQGRGLQTFDHGHHLWATSWFLMGDIERVVSWIDYIDGIVDSPAVIMWKHKDGMKYGMCEYTYGNELEIPSKYYGNDEWIEISGTKGVIIINRCTGMLRDGPAVSLFSGTWRHFEAPDDWVEGFKGSTLNFINSILGHEKPLLSAEEGRYILKFGIAIQKSNRLHREVYLSELDSKVPVLVACFNRARHVLRKMPRKNIFEMLGIGGNTEQYAAQARELTQELAKRFNPAAAEGWSTVMGLQLTPEGSSPSMNFTMRVRDGRAELIEGSLPDDPVFTISVPAGTWAAILLKKKKVEMALVQGKLKIQGKSEEALKLKAAFGL
jgi:predicted dehydrogenase